ncbi:hypothetical protein y223_00044 [Bordetella phage PY223]
MFDIEDGVPLPDRYLTRSRGRPQKWPFDRMRVGQSFHVKGYEEYERAKLAVQYWGRKTGFRFTCAKDKDGDGGRIWRTE